MQIKGTMVAVLLTCTNVYHYTVTGDMIPMQKIAQNQTVELTGCPSCMHCQ